MRDFIEELVSTIIPVYNRAIFLEEAVESVLDQTHRPIEIILVDDGSTDGTVEMIDRCAVKHPDIITVIHQENAGPGPSREAGRRVARGEFIQYLDSDDRLHPEKFERQIAVLRDNPECGVAYGITRLMDMEGKVLQEPFKWTAKQINYLFPGLLVDRWWCTHTPLYRRSVCDCIGPWSDLRYSQDWEYDARVGGGKIKIVNCNKLVSDHRTHSGMRQTGHGKWLSPYDRVRFFSTLYLCACQAGVEKTAPEMQHFARWVFSQARMCGAMGDAGSAQNLFALAIEASIEPDKGMKLNDYLSRVLGWRLTGKLCMIRERLSGGRTRKQSLKQSWMEEPGNE